MQLQTIAERNLTSIAQEFHVPENKRNVIMELCRIVAYYHLVEAVDNGSAIHSNLRMNANDALTYWVSLLFQILDHVIIN